MLSSDPNGAVRIRQSSSEALTLAAKAYMEAHSTERFSLQKMAGDLFVNGSYLLRAFKRHTGMTPLSYHHAVRCRKAKSRRLARAICPFPPAMSCSTGRAFPAKSA